MPIYKIQGEKPHVIPTRSTGQNQRAFFADSLLKVDWTTLYSMPSCEDQLLHFQATIIMLLNTHMPLTTTKKCCTDRPWITARFKELLAQRQRAHKRCDMDEYRRLRNKANIVNKSLRSAYYRDTVENLKSNDTKKWWNGVKQLTGSTINTKNNLVGLANSVCDGDTKQLAEEINAFFQSVSHDLPTPDKSPH